jgi:hypothetical protein
MGAFDETSAAEQGLSMNAAIERPSTELAMLKSDISSNVLSVLANAPSITEVDDIL